MLENFGVQVELLLTVADRRLGSLAFRDVADDRQMVALSIERNDAPAHFHRKGSAAAVALHRFVGTACGRPVIPVVLKAPASRRIAQLYCVHAAQFGQRIAVGLDRALVGFDDVVVLIEQQNYIVGIFGDVFQALPRCLLLPPRAVHVGQ